MSILSKMLSYLSTQKNWVQEENIPLVNSKFDRIDQLICNKDVLDCGCVGDTINNFAEFQNSSHAIHKSHAKYILGVDIWEEEVKKRQEMGLNIIYANVETMELNRFFDAVIAGDLIEHLANPGLFLGNANRHLNTGGLLYICTPNPFSLNSFVRTFLGTKINVHPEHCSWYDFTTLKQLLSRYGFKVKETYWQDYSRRKSLKYVLRFRKSFASSIIIIAEKTE